MGELGEKQWLTIFLFVPSALFLYLALYRSIVPGYLPQLQPDTDTGATGYGSESPGSVKCQFKYYFMPNRKFALFFIKPLTSFQCKENMYSLSVYLVYQAKTIAFLQFCIKSYLHKVQVWLKLFTFIFMVILEDVSDQILLCYTKCFFFVFVFNICPPQWYHTDPFFSNVFYRPQMSDPISHHEM